MQFVHLVYTPYDTSVGVPYATREAAEAAADHGEEIASIAVQPYEPRQGWRFSVRCYYDGGMVFPESTEITVDAWDAWDAENAIPTITHNEHDETGRYYALIIVDAWDGTTAAQVAATFAMTLERPPDDDGPVQGPPSPVEHCERLSREGGARGMVHTGSSVDVYNTGRRWGPGDYAGARRTLILPSALVDLKVAELEEAYESSEIPENPEPGFQGYDERWWEEMSPDAHGSTAPYIRIVGGVAMPSHAPFEGEDRPTELFNWATAEAMKAQLQDAKREGNRSDIVQFIVLVVLLCAVGYIGVALVAWALG